MADPDLHPIHFVPDVVCGLCRSHMEYLYEGHASSPDTARYRCHNCGVVVAVSFTRAAAVVLDRDPVLTSVGTKGSD